VELFGGYADDPGRLVEGHLLAPVEVGHQPQQPADLVAGRAGGRGRHARTPAAARRRATTSLRRDAGCSTYTSGPRASSSSACAPLGSWRRSQGVASSGPSTSGSTLAAARLSTMPAPGRTSTTASSDGAAGASRRATSRPSVPGGISNEPGLP